MIALVIVLFTSVENLRRFGESGAGTGDILRITLLQAPEVLYQVFPLVLMLASLATFLRLARTSELVVMRAAGISALQLIAVPVLAAIVLGIGFVMVVNPFVAASIKRGLALEDEFRGSGSSLLSFSPEGVWLRQADPGRRPDGDPGGAHQRRRHHPQPRADAPLRREPHALRPARGAGGAADAGLVAARERDRVAAARQRALRARRRRPPASTWRPR